MSEKFLALACELNRINEAISATLSIKEGYESQIRILDEFLKNLDVQKLQITDKIANLATQNFTVAHSNVRDENPKIFHIFKTDKGGGND